MGKYRYTVCAAAGLLGLSLSAPAHATEAATTSTTTNTTTTTSTDTTAGAVPAAENAEASPAPGTTSVNTDASSIDWGKLGFAVGIGVTFLDHADIKDATVENGIVHVTDETKYRTGIWLETHYKFKINDKLGWGPFLGTQVGSDNGLFDAVGAGLMFCMRRNTKPDKDGLFNNLAFNVGLGATVQNVKVLGSGFKDGGALPDGAEAIRYKKQDDVGVLLLFSFAFASGNDGTTDPGAQGSQPRSR